MEQCGLWPTAMKQYQSTAAACVCWWLRFWNENSRPARHCSQGVQTSPFTPPVCRVPLGTSRWTLVKCHRNAHRPEIYSTRTGQVEIIAWRLVGNTGGSGHSDPGRGVRTRTADGEGQSWCTHGCFRLKAGSGYVWFPSDSWPGCRGKSCVAKQES